MKNSELFFIYLDDYFDRLRLELKSDRTLTTYKTSINCFKEYMTGVRNLKLEKICFSDISDDLIREYLKYLIDNGKSISTRNTRFIPLKNYIAFCADKDLAIVPLFLKISKIKVKKVIPKKHNWLNKEQIILLLSQPPQNRIGIRDRFIMLFIFSTGARLDEALSVKLKDIHVDNEPYVLLTGKGNKPRIVPLTRELVNNLKEYFKLYHPYIKSEDYLFYVYRYGEKRKMSQDNVQRLMNKYGADAKLTDSSFPDIHPHMLRHSYGAILYREHLSKTEIAKLMGHESEITTERYVETDEAFIRESLKPILENNGIDLFDTLSKEDKLKLEGKC